MSNPSVTPGVVKPAPEIAVRVQTTVKGPVDHFLHKGPVVIVATHPADPNVQWFKENHYRVTVILSIDSHDGRGMRDVVHRSMVAQAAEAVLKNPMPLFRRMNETNASLKARFKREPAPSETQHLPNAVHKKAKTAFVNQDQP